MLFHKVFRLNENLIGNYDSCPEKNSIAPIEAAPCKAKSGKMDRKKKTKPFAEN